MSEANESVEVVGPGETWASARLPHLEIEIVHRTLPGGTGEQISINLQAMPSFEAFGRLLESANPFAVWAQATQLALFPWLGAAGAMLPWLNAPQLPKPRDDGAGT